MSGYNLLLVFFWGLAPLLLGKLLVFNKSGTKRFSWTFEYVLGFIGSLVIFHILCVPMVIKGTTISRLGKYYTIILLILSLCSILCNKKSWIVSSKFSIKKKYSIVFILACIVIGVQILRCVFFMPTYYSDDITYMSMINDMASTDKVYSQYWWSGIDKPSAEMSYKYRYTSYYPWVAVIARLTKIHPLILCKTLMPILYIMMFYMIWWMFAEWIYEGNVKKQEYFLFFLSIIALFAGYSQYTISKRLLLYVWNGKTVLAVIILPFLFYCTNIFMEHKATIRELLILVLVAVAAVVPSLMGVGLAPIMVMVICLVAAIRKKKIFPVLQGVLVCIPMAMYMVVVLLGKA